MSSSKGFEKMSRGDLIKKIRKLTCELETAVSANESRFRQMMAFSTDAVFIHSLSGQLMDVNPAACELYGYSREEFLKKKLKDLHPQTELSRVREAIKQISHSSRVRFESKVKRGDGTVLDVEISAQLIDEKRKLCQGVVRDITARKEAERALQASEEHFRIAIESLPFDFFMLDSKETYIIQNSVCREHWGDVIGKRPEDITPDKNVLALWKRNNRRALKGAIVNEETVFTHAGLTRHVHNIVAPIKTGKKVTAILGINIDITDRKLTEQALLQSEKKLALQNIDLQEKNIAIRQILEQLKQEKEQLEKRVLENIEKLLLPLVRRLQKSAVGMNEQYLGVLEQEIKDLTSSFGVKLSSGMNQLSAREMEICGYIKNGLTTKEIASLLHLSKKTVDNHRNNIRHKLELANAGTSLATWLNNLS